MALETISFSTEEGQGLLGHCCAWGQDIAWQKQVGGPNQLPRKLTGNHLLKASGI